MKLSLNIVIASNVMGIQINRVQKMRIMSVIFQHAIFSPVHKSHSYHSNEMRAATVVPHVFIFSAVPSELVSYGFNSVP